MRWPFRRTERIEPPKAERIEPPKTDYPAGYVAHDGRPNVFDPALKQYRFAYVKGPPADSNEAAALVAVQSRLLRRSLDAIARSSLRDLLVLRGSLTLEAWFPDRARRARDMDLVVRDSACEPGGPAADSLISRLAATVADALAAADVSVLREQISIDEIWTYERAEGRRLSVPWRSGGSIQDAIQIDLVFREPLQDTPVLEGVREDDGSRGYRDGQASAWFASKAESLAWKLLWLETDNYPQGKDLYDAVLLAEDTTLSVDLVRRVYSAKGERWEHGLDTRFVQVWGVDWERFALEYPALAAGGREEWLSRLGGGLRLAP
jgi:hypothetical protein